MHNTPTANQSVANYITIHQTIASKSDQQVALEVGLPNANAVAMIKQGTIKVPFDKVVALAKALKVSSSDLFNLVLSEYEPAISAAASDIWPSGDLSHNERELISSYRHLSQGRDVAPLIMDGQSIIALVVA